MLELQATDGMLLKHPVAVGKDFVLLDFKETEWKVKLIGQARIF